MFLKDEIPTRISLTSSAKIDSIGFEYFKLDNALFEIGEVYYGRIEMPVYPKRDVGVFFTAVDEKLAKFIKMHDRDEKEWCAYMTARERVLIREAKEDKL